MKTLSRDSIQRMAGGVSSNTSISGGGGGGGGTGLSAAWVDTNYISIEFFKMLFEVHINTKVTVTDGLTTTETNTPGVLLPNDPIPEDVVEPNTPSEGWTTTTHVSIESIEAKSNFWSSLAISALGQGSGGGGGGATALSQLVDVQLSNIQNGQALVYDSTLNKWVNSNVQGGSTAWADITGKPTTISGYGITDAKIQNGTITLGSNSITPLTSVAFSDLTSHPSTLSGYGITDAMLTKILSSTSDIDTLYVAGSYRFTATAQGTWPTGVTANYGQMLVICGGGDTVAQIFFPYGDTQAYLRVGNPMNANNGSWKGWKRLVTPDMNVASATKLATARTLWGQSFDGTANVSGDMSSVGSIEMSSLLYMANGMSIQFKDSGGNYRNVLTFNASNQLAIGYHVRQQGYVTDIQGGSITFGVGVNRVEAMEINSSGLVWVRQGTQGLRIGNGLLTWDSANNALKVSDYNGNSANLYALGGVSALGFSSSGGTTSINSLTVNDSILVKDYAGNSKKALSVALAASASETSRLIIGEGWKDLYHDTVISGYNIRFDVGQHDAAVTINGAGMATFNYYLKSGRYYLDASRYLYLDASNVLKYNDNGTVRTIAFS